MARLIPLGRGLFRVLPDRPTRKPLRQSQPQDPVERAAPSASQRAADRLRDEHNATFRFQQLIGELGEIYTPTGVLIWLDSANHHLDGKTPRFLIARGTDDDWAQLLNESGRLTSW